MSQIRRGGRTGGRPSPRHFLIFLSSPGDVADERRLSRKLIKERLPVDPFLRDRATFDAVSWDDPDAGTPMLGTMTPQKEPFDRTVEDHPLSKTTTFTSRSRSSSHMISSSCGIVLGPKIFGGG